MNPDNLERQMGRQQIQHRAGTTVSGVDDHLERFESGSINITKEMFDISPLRIKMRDDPFSLHWGEGIARCQITDIVQTAVAADRSGPLPHQFHPVIIKRIVTGGHHDPTVHLLGKGGKIDLFRPAQTDIKDISPAIGQPLRQCPTEGFA